MIEPVKIRWKKLNNILNNVIIKNLNLQHPVKGDGISLSQTASGTIISTAKREEGADGEDKQPRWLKVDVMDENCRRSTIWVWGTTTDPTGGNV